MFYYTLFDALVLQAPMMRVAARPLDTGGCLGRSRDRLLFPADTVEANEYGRAVLGDLCILYRY